MIKKIAGFSLIEVLVSITVLTVIGVAISTILTRTFRGNTKTELIGNVKYNGQTVLGVIEKEIRDSDTVVCPASGTSAILTLLTKTGGKYTRFSIVTEQGAVNGTINTEQFIFSSPPATPSQLCDLVFYPLNQQTNLRSLMDSTSKTAVSLKNISGTGFTVIKNPGFKDTVKVQFDLGPAIGSSSNVENNLGGANTVRFQTTIQIR